MEDSFGFGYYRFDKLLPKIMPDLPVELNERIRNLGGTKVTLVIQKALSNTDVSATHKRLALPGGELIDNEFLSGALSGRRKNRKGVEEIQARLIAENGKEHETDIREWNYMSNGMYNVVKGWNDIVSEHRLCKGLEVQLWSFRVGENLWFALVKLWMNE